MSSAKTTHAERVDKGAAEELGEFGYKQELLRSLGAFSLFAAGFSCISVLTGVYELFGFGFGNAGGAVWWSWPVVLAGQMMFALCFAELAGQFPLAGSTYQWSKRLGSDFASWMTGWLALVAWIVVIAGVAVGWQVVLPQVSTHLEFIGSAANAGTSATPDGAKNALLLGGILIVVATVINMRGVKPLARVNNIGVIAELVGAATLIILLAFHFHRGPAVVTQTLGTGSGHQWGYLGAILIGGIVSAWVMGGFDTAGTLSEEAKEPRRKAPWSILRALLASGLVGGVLILFALMATGNLHDKNVGVLGLPYIVKQALGSTAGNIFLIDGAIAIAVCTLASVTACTRLLFSMSRDGLLPGGGLFARVSRQTKVPILPAAFAGCCALVLLLVNIANQSAFAALISLAVIVQELIYVVVASVMLRRRLRKEWPRPNHGGYFSLGRWGLLINILAVVYGSLVCFEIAWPREAIYGHQWYYRFGAYEFIGAVLVAGALYYVLVQRRRASAALGLDHAVVPGAAVTDSLDQVPG